MRPVYPAFAIDRDHGPHRQRDIDPEKPEIAVQHLGTKQPL
jgi:hypothetical protein